MSQSVAEGDSNVKEKKKNSDQFQGLTMSFLCLAVLYLCLTREGTAAEIPTYKYKRQNRSPLTSLDSLSH